MPRQRLPSNDWLLEHTREKVLAGLAGLGLATIAAVVLTNIYIPETYRRVLWGAGITAALILILGYWNVFRYRAVNVALSVMLTLLILFVGQHHLQQGESPVILLPWLLLINLTIFITAGSLIGGILSLLLLTSLLGMLVLYPPSAILAWLNGLLTSSGVGLMGYMLMRFIENNVLLQEQTSDRLRAARLDALTGAYGRAATEEELRRNIEHARRSQTPLSILVTDIDHFKLVNDRHGHAAGDDVLRAFAKRLRRNVGGSGGLVGRWGGEEFLIILPGMARPDAFAMAEHLRSEVSNSPLASLRITASFGLASFRGHGDDADQLFARADERLYEAKNAGRNMVK